MRTLSLLVPGPIEVRDSSCLVGASIAKEYLSFKPASSVFHIGVALSLRVSDMGRSVRFLINKNGILKDVFQMVYNHKDASLYFFLSGGLREYRYGAFPIPEGAQQFQFNCESGFFTNRVPKLSYHQSGEIHIRHDGNDCHIRKVPFTDMRWSHILSVVVASVDELNQRQNAGEGDVVVEGFKYDSARFIIYANSQGQIITVDVDDTFQHPDCSLTFGYKHVNQSRLNTTGAGGIILLTGWTVGQTTPIKDSGLFIQGIP